MSRIRLTGPIDEETRELLEAYHQSLAQNPLQDFHPHGKQKPFLSSQSKTKVFLGGNRSGKSTCGVIDDLIQAVPESLLPEHLLPYKRWHPPFYCRIVTPDFTRTMAAVMEAIRRWAPKDALLGGGWDKAYDKQNRVLRLIEGSFIEFMTYEQDVDKFGGSARHRIHFDEEPPGDKGELVRQECSMRLIDYQGDELFTFTPLLGLTWTYDELWERRGKETQKDVWANDDLVVVRADMDDNPHLSEEGKEAALRLLPAKVRAARKAGNFTHFKGLVFDEFDPEVHEVDPPPISHISDMTVIVGIDPGIRTTGVVFTAFDKENSMLVFDELYLHDEDAIPNNVTTAIGNVLRRWRTEAEFCVIDPSARNRSLVDGERTSSAYMRAGLNVVPGQNDVEAGIFEIKRRLESGGLFVSRKCENWLRERSRYRQDPKPDGSFAVVKRDDHLMDPTRYVAMSIVWEPPAPQPERPRVHTQNFQPPYSEERPIQPTPPMGAFS